MVSGFRDQPRVAGFAAGDAVTDLRGGSATGDGTGRIPGQIVRVNPKLGSVVVLWDTGVRERLSGMLAQKVLGRDGS